MIHESHLKDDLEMSLVEQWTRSNTLTLILRNINSIIMFALVLSLVLSHLRVLNIKFNMEVSLNLSH